MTEELPEGWGRFELGALIRPSKQKAEPSETNGRPYVGLEHIESDTNRIVGHGSSLETKSTAVVFSKNDVLFSKLRPYLNKVALAPFDGVGSTEILVFETRPELESKYLMWLLSRRETVRIANERAAGVQLPRVTFDKIADIEVPVAPVAEQRRIVRKVEALLEQVNQAKARLDRVPLILKRFRQSVLDAACSGELTREWRDSHPSVQSAQALLAAIAAKRAKLDLPTSTRNILDEGIEIPDLELPASWAWCRAGEIADIRLGGTPSRKEPSYWNGDVPWVSSGEVANCRIRGTTERITRKGLENSSAKLYPPGTVLIAMIGEGKTRGQSAILDIEAATNQNAAGLVFDAGAINPEYIWYWALQEYAKNRDEGRGGNQPALNGGKVRALPVPLPPVDEQNEIVRTLKGMLGLADAIERRVRFATGRADKLPQAILSKAFSGELVPTEAELARIDGRSYESADELLKRVTAPAAPAPSNGKVMGPRTRRKTA